MVEGKGTGEGCSGKATPSFITMYRKHHLVGHHRGAPTHRSLIYSSSRPPPASPALPIHPAAPHEAAAPILTFWTLNL